MKKILFIPPGIQGGWYLESYYEYLIRYLSDEFFIEMAQVPYPPYKNFLDRPENSPFMRNPDDYDLLVPLLPSHWGVIDRDRYKHKVSLVLYEPGEGDWARARTLAIANPLDEGSYNKPTYKVGFGIDTEIFKPLKMQREDDLLHVGVVGSYGNPRRQIVEGIKPLYNMKGIRWMFFPQNWMNNGGNLEPLGGQEFKKRVVAGGKSWPGIANLYNQLDVLVRIDNSYGISFPVLEAAACGVPVIATNQGIDHLITKKGGILLEPEEGGRWPLNRSEELVSKLQNALEFMLEYPKKRKEMGRAGRKEILQNWTWNKYLDGWREFLRA